MPGPNPDPHAKRRNAPTIPTTELPVSGRGEKAPTCPVKLGRAGRRWWTWAWKTPQAAAWSTGNLYTVAHRAQLEDDLAALDEVDAGIDWEYLLDLDEKPSAVLRRLDALITRIRAIAGNRVQITKACTELDDRLGLTPKGMTALRWQVVEDPEEDPQETPDGAPAPDDEVGQRREQRRAAIS